MSFIDPAGQEWTLGLREGRLVGLVAWKGGGKDEPLAEGFAPQGSPAPLTRLSGEVSLDPCRGRRRAGRRPASATPTAGATTDAPKAPAKGSKFWPAFIGANIVGIGAFYGIKKATDDTGGGGTATCSPRYCVYGGVSDPCNCNLNITSGASCGQTTNGVPFGGVCNDTTLPCQANLSCNNKRLRRPPGPLPVLSCRPHPRAPAARLSGLPPVLTSRPGVAMDEKRTLPVLNQGGTGPAEAGVARRRVLQGLVAGAGVVLPGVSEAHPMREHAHSSAAETAQARAKAPDWKPEFLDAHQFATLTALCARIVPGSDTAHADRFVDSLLAVETRDRQQRFLTALGALEGEALRRFAKPFKAAHRRPAGRGPDRRPRPPRPGTQDWVWTPGTPVENPPAGPEVVTLRDHFDHLKGWIAGAYYSSEAGLKELGYTGQMFFAEFPDCKHVEHASRDPMQVLEPPKVHPVIVIGSGAAGGMAAWNLTRKGIDVLMLDAGDEFDRAQLLDPRAARGRSASAPPEGRAAALASTSTPRSSPTSPPTTGPSSSPGSGASGARPTSGAGCPSATRTWTSRAPSATAGRSPGPSPTRTWPPTTTRSRRSSGSAGATTTPTSLPGSRFLQPAPAPRCGERLIARAAASLGIPVVAGRRANMTQAHPRLPPLPLLRQLRPRLRHRVLLLLRRPPPALRAEDRPAGDPQERGGRPHPHRRPRPGQRGAVLRTTAPAARRWCAARWWWWARPAWTAPASS